MFRAYRAHAHRCGIALALFLAAGSVFAAEPTDPPERDGSTRPLVVAIAESPPFAIKDSDGTWSGLSIDLWREVATGLGFAERTAGALSWRTTLAALTSSHLLRLVTTIFAATLFVGILITLIERRHNTGEFGGPWGRGIATGVWWAAVTMTTVGYGDTTPKTATGRSLALLWMFIGVVAVAIFTATVTSSLTLSSLRGEVRHEADLFRLRLGAVAGSAGAEFLTRRHVSFVPAETYEQALAELAAHEVDAVIANAPSLRYLTSRQWQGVLRVSPIVLEPLTYAIGLPSGSAFREPIKRSLLRIIEQDRWRDVERQYLGHS